MPSVAAKTSVSSLASGHARRRERIRGVVSRTSPMRRVATTNILRGGFINTDAGPYRPLICLVSNAPSECVFDLPQAQPAAVSALSSWQPLFQFRSIPSAGIFLFSFPPRMESHSSSHSPVQAVTMFSGRSRDSSPSLATSTPVLISG